MILEEIKRFYKTTSCEELKDILHCSSNGYLSCIANFCHIYNVVSILCILKHLVHDFHCIILGLLALIIVHPVFKTSNSGNQQITRWYVICWFDVCAIYVKSFPIYVHDVIVPITLNMLETSC